MLFSRPLLNPQLPRAGHLLVLLHRALAYNTNSDVPCVAAFCLGRLILAPICDGGSLLLADQREVVRVRRVPAGLWSKNSGVRLFLRDCAPSTGDTIPTELLITTRHCYRGSYHGYSMFVRLLFTTVTEHFPEPSVYDCFFSFQEIYNNLLQLLLLLFRLLSFFSLKLWYSSCWKST